MPLAFAYTSFTAVVCDATSRLVAGEKPVTARGFALGSTVRRSAAAPRTVVLIAGLTGSGGTAPFGRCARGST